MFKAYAKTGSHKSYVKGLSLEKNHLTLQLQNNKITCQITTKYPLVTKSETWTKKLMTNLTFCSVKFLCPSKYRIHPSLFLHVIPADLFIPFTCEFLKLLKAALRFLMIKKMWFNRAKDKSLLLFPFVNTTIFSFTSLTLSFFLLSVYLNSLLLVNILSSLSLKSSVHGKAPQKLVVCTALSWKVRLYKRDESPMIFMWTQIHLQFFIFCTCRNSGRTQLFNLLHQ